MANQQPTFTAYSVLKKEGQDDFWLAVGAAFRHRDGEGYNIILQALPVDGKVVLRPPKAQDEVHEPATKQTERRNDRRRDR